MAVKEEAPVKCANTNRGRPQHPAFKTKEFQHEEHTLFKPSVQQYAAW